MKLLSTFKITKGFVSWLKMYKEIEPHLNGLGIKVLWEGNKSSETQVYDITGRRAKAGVELQSKEIVAKDYCA